MADSVKNIFNEIAADPALTEGERIKQLTAAIDALLEGPMVDAVTEVKLLEPYYQFKRPVTAMFKALDEQSRKIRESSLVTRVEPLAAEAAACGPDDDVSENAPLRVKSAALRQKLAEERKMLADMAAPNAQLTATYKTILAAEEKAARLPSIIVEESRAALRMLDNTRDPSFFTNIQDSVETILNNIDKQLDAVAGHQHKLLEKKMFHRYLDAGLTTGGKPLPAPATARFRRKPQVQP